MSNRQIIGKRAFTLTEVAIVLGIIGIVLGALWALVGPVWTGLYVNKAMQQVMDVVQNTRGFYDLSRGKLPTNTTCHPLCLNKATPYEITGVLNINRLIPVEMRTTTGLPTAGEPIRHAMDGRFRVFSYSSPPISASKINMMTVWLNSLTQDECVKFIMKFPIATTELGVREIGTTLGGSGAITVSTAITLAQARNWCNLPGKTNNVYIDLALRN